MGKTILIVDDSVAVRQSARFTLEQAGYSVHEAGDGLEALSALDAKGADLVITDVNMPNMDGIALVARIRARGDGKFKPILVLTTESQGPAVQRGKDAGATGWIVKPYTADKLIDTVRRVLG